MYPVLNVARSNSFSLHEAHVPCTYRSAVFRYDDGEEVNETLVVAGRPWLEASLIRPPLFCDNDNTLTPKVL